MRFYGCGIGRAPVKYVVVLDCDGTVIKESILKALLDVKLMTRSLSLEENEKMVNKAIRGALTKKDELMWFAEAMKDIMKARLSLDQVFAVVRKIELKPGVIDCLQMLENMNVPVVIVSYGIAEFIAMIVPEEYLGGIFK